MKGYKTILVAIAIAIFGVLEQSGFIGLVPAGFEGAALSVVAVIMAYLRTITTTPIGK